MSAVGAFLGTLLLLIVVSFALRIVYDYRLRNGAVEVVICGLLPIYRISANKIEHVERVPWRQLGVGGTTLRLGNRLVGQAVLIRKRSGVFRRVAISPRDPDAFVAAVNDMLHREPARSMA